MNNNTGDNIFAIFSITALTAMCTFVCGFIDESNHKFTKVRNKHVTKCDDIQIEYLKNRVEELERKKD